MQALDLLGLGGALQYQAVKDDVSAGAVVAGRVQGGPAAPARA
jgi:hypothetical protein